VDQEHPDNREASRRRPVVWLTTVVALGATVSAVGLAGGLASGSSGPQQYGPGTPVDQVRFTVTVLGARIAMVKSLFGTTAKRSLVVKLRIVNNGTESASVDTDFTEGMAGEPQPGKYAKVGNITGTASDGTGTSTVEPGLPITAEASWELAAGVSPAKVTIALRQWEHRPGFTDPAYAWWMTTTSTVTAEITVPVARS
jgi:hypothetical protein